MEDTLLANSTQPHAPFDMTVLAKVLGEISPDSQILCNALEDT
jgi:hypothetical protein